MPQKPFMLLKYFYWKTQQKFTCTYFTFSCSTVKITLTIFLEKFRCDFIPLLVESKFSYLHIQIYFLLQ